MKKKIRISCLPVAGIENPYQYLMIKGLRTDKRLIVQTGSKDRFMGILRTALTQRPHYIHFDWETSFYYRRRLWMTVMNIPFFVLQIYVVRYILRCKLVWTPHNIIPHDSKNLTVHRVCRRFFARNMKWIRLFSEVSLPEAMKELKSKKSKFKIVPEGSYIEFYPNSISRCEARKQLKIADNKFVLLYIGFIKPYKGVTELIDWFKKSFSHNTVLILAGEANDPNYLNEIQKSINENIVVFNRFIKDDELQIFFNAADVVTLPFKEIENSGSVILAMGFKKPVIAPRMGTIIERLKNQTELLYAKSLEESSCLLKQITNQDLIDIGKKNFQELFKYKWSDFANVF